MASTKAKEKAATDLPEAEDTEHREAASAEEQAAAQEHTDPEIVQTSSQLDDPDRDEEVTPSTAVNPDGSIDRDMNGAARSTGSVAIKPLYDGGEEEPLTRRLEQQERYEATRHKIINAYKRNR